MVWRRKQTQSAMGKGQTKGAEVQTPGKSSAMAKGQAKCADTEPSRAVSDRSTTSARSSLTSLFGWEAVTLEEMAAHADSRLNFDLYCNNVLHVGGPVVSSENKMCRH